MDIFPSRIVPSWRNPYYSRSIDSHPFAREVTQPSWCTPVLLRAWDCYSWCQLPLLDDSHLNPRAKEFCTGAFTDDNALEQALDSLDKRAAALEHHATYVDYDVCFISMQMDWHSLMNQARRLHHRECRRGAGYTYITAINARRLSQKKWKLLRMGDELKAGNIRLEHYITGGAPWQHELYKDEVLAVERIPEDCILSTFRLEDIHNWQTDATTWRDEYLIPELKKQLGWPTIPGFSPKLFKSSGFE